MHLFLFRIDVFSIKKLCITFYWGEELSFLYSFLVLEFSSGFSLVMISFSEFSKMKFVFMS